LCFLVLATVKNFSYSYCWLE